MPDIDWDWLDRNRDDIQEYLIQHLRLVGLTMAIAILIAIPLAIAIRNNRAAFAVVTGLADLGYVIPSLALFAFLVPIVGIGTTPAVIALVVYAMHVLIVNAATGLREVPPDVKESARGMGMGAAQSLVRVELPLALPSIMAGIRLATSSTVALAVIAVYIGAGGLGELVLNDGVRKDLFVTPIVAGLVLSVALALLFEAVLLAAQWLLTPWTRRGRAA